MLFVEGVVPGADIAIAAIAVAAIAIANDQGAWSAVAVEFPIAFKFFSLIDIILALYAQIFTGLDRLPSTRRDLELMVFVAPLNKQGHGLELGWLEGRHGRRIGTQF